MSLSIKQNMFWNSLGSLTYLICQWLVTVLVARLSTAGYDSAGALSIAMSVSNIYASIAIYKMRAYQVSDIKGQYSQGEYVGFRLQTILLGAIVCAIYTMFTCRPEVFLTVGLYIIFRTGDVLINVYHGVDQMSYRMDICGKSMMIRGILFLVSFTVIFSSTNNLNLALLGMIASTYPILFCDIKAASNFADVRPQFCKATSRKLLVECFPAVLGASFFLATTSLSRQLLGYIDGQNMLGIYASVCTPVVIIQAVADYIYTPLLGVFADSFLHKDDRRFRSYLFKVVLGIMLFGLACLAGFALLGPIFLSIVFNQEIASYSFLLYPACICVMCTAMTTFMNELLITLRQMKFISFANGLGLVLSVFMTLPLIKLFGMNGVSYSISISYLVSTSLMLSKTLSIIKKWKLA